MVRWSDDPISRLLLRRLRSLFGGLSSGSSESSACQAAVIDSAFHLVTGGVQFSGVVDGGAGRFKVDHHFIALDGTVNGGFAQRAGIRSGQLLAVLLQNERRRTALAAQINLHVPRPGNIGSEQ